MQAKMSDQGHTNWRSVLCPSCGQSVAWTVATSHNAKVACTNEVGERNNKKKCGFTLRRAEWDYIRENPKSHMTHEFIRRELEKWTKRKAGK